MNEISDVTMDSIPALHRRTKRLRGQKLIAGTILSFTRIHHPPEGFGSTPYTVALIQLSDGVKVCAQLTGDRSPAIGATVVPHFRHIRTMGSGLRINDLKYVVAERRPVEESVMRCYVLALTGPSGVGKTTITRALMHLLSAYCEQLPIYTTRKPKRDETEPYRHVSEEQFDRMLESNEIIAHTSMSSKTEQRRYGYRKFDIEHIWNAGKLPIVVTDIHLLKGLEQSLGRRAILSFGLLPPGNSRRHMLSALLHRLRGRGRETPEQIKERLQVAELDLEAFDAHPHLFDHLLVNDRLEVCLETIEEIVRSA